MKPTRTLRSVEEVRALADPLRLRLIELLVADEHAAADLARLVEVPVTRLYHHLDLMLESGLIEVVRRVPRRGMEERIFRASARRFVLAEDLVSPDGEGAASLASLEELARTVLVGAFDRLIEGLRSGAVQPGKPGRGVLMQNRLMRLSPAGFEALARELPAWLDAFARRHEGTAGGYRVALALFPGEGGMETEPADAQPKDRPGRGAGRRSHR